MPRKIAPIKILTWVIAAGAPLLAMSFYFVQQSGPHIMKLQTTYGERKLMQLPCNSLVYLEPRSSIEYDQDDWNDHRQIKLIGSASFEIEAGASPFYCETDFANVEITEGSFVLKNRALFKKINSYKKSIVITSKNNKKQIILEPYHTYYAIKNEPFKITKNENQSMPDPNLPESTFENAPLFEVITELENQFDVKFGTEFIDLNQQFTGSFKHASLDGALNDVFIPLSIRYNVEGKTIRLSSVSTY